MEICKKWGRNPRNPSDISISQGKIRNIVINLTVLGVVVGLHQARATGQDPDLHLIDIIIDLVNIDILIPILILLIHHLHHHPDHLLQVHRVQKQDQQNMSESTATERGTKPKIKISHQQTRICLAMITSEERNIHQDLHQIRQLPIMSHTQINLLLLQIRKRAEPLSMPMQIKLGPEICPKIYLMKGKHQRTRVSRLQSASLKLMVEQYPPFGRKV